MTGIKIWWLAAGSVVGAVISSSTQTGAPGPARRAKAIVEATTHYKDPKILADISQNLGEPMVGISVSTLAEGETLADRGW